MKQDLCSDKSCCDNCGLETEDLKPLDMMTGDGEIDWFCEECYNDWHGIKPEGKHFVFR